MRKVDAGSELVNQSGTVLQEIVASVKRVSDIVAEIAAGIPGAGSRHRAGQQGDVANGPGDADECSPDRGIVVERRGTFGDRRAIAGLGRFVLDRADSGGMPSPAAARSVAANADADGG